MNVRLLFPVLLVVASQCLAITEISQEASLDEVVADSREALDFARRGQYGRLSSFEIRSARAAVDRIEELTEGKRSFGELSVEDQAALHEARVKLDEVLRLNNKNRIICTKRAVLGTRVAKQECLTLGEREERARRARREVHEMQHPVVCGLPGAESVGGRCLTGG